MSAGSKLIPSIHEAWHQLHHCYRDELGEEAAGALNGAIVNLTNGGRT
jgi:hypothetical protein